MIPTTVSNSPSTACTSGGSGSSQQSTASAMIGIASLILEGRAIAEDEYQTPQSSRAPPVGTDTVSPGSAGPNGDNRSGSSGGGGGSGGGYGQTLSDRLLRQHSPKPSTSRSAQGLTSGSGSSGGSVSSGGTDRGGVLITAASSSSGHPPINITTNPTHNLDGLAALVRLFNPHGSGGGGSTAGGGGGGSSTGAGGGGGGSSSESSPSSGGSQMMSTHQRWTQKLSQLRQASPAANFSLVYEQRVSADRPSTSRGDNEFGDVDAVDCEFVRRATQNRNNVLASAMNASPASSSADSDGHPHPHSLLSLTTTYLRGEPGAYQYATLATSPAAVSPRYATQTHPQPHTFPAPSTPAVDLPCTSRFAARLAGSEIDSVGPGTGSGAETTARERFMWQTSVRSPIPPAVAAAATMIGSIAAATPTTTATTKNATSTSSKCPQQGPHCDQFLRKMGLAKGEAAEAEDHVCDMSYVNITCSRWRAYCLKMEAIIEREESVCIEVYLGPVGHKILLEQWIIARKEKVPPPTMSLPSLCSAIRSQLYFSQISAWCDLIKKSDASIYDTGRIIYPTPTGAAGDLATSSASSSPNANVTPGSSPGSSSSSTASPLTQLTAAALLNRRPRLNIFYRIKQYDSTACFNSKPNVHNFPNVNISENCSISICLKSLPRLGGGIPRIGANTAVAGTATTTTAISTATTTPTIEMKMNSGRTSGRGRATAENGGNSSGRSEVERPSIVGIAGGSYGRPAANVNNCDIPKEASCAPVGEAAAKTHSASERDRDRVGSGTGSGSGKGNGNGNGGRDGHKYPFSMDEEDCDGGDLDASGDGPNNICGNNGNSLSHREKQLLKYRKRMQRRDKKNRPEPMSGLSSDTLSDMRSNTSDENSQSQPMDQGEEDAAAPTGGSGGGYGGGGRRRIEMISTGTQTQTQTQTQTESTCCQQCGNEKALVCLKCVKIVDDFDRLSGMADNDLDDLSSISSLSSSEIIQTPRNKGELLLQAIQRAPKSAKLKKLTNRSDLGSVFSTASAPSKLQNNNHMSVEPVISNSGMGCQVCKRQKTQHDFSSGRSMNGDPECDTNGSTAAEGDTADAAVVNADDDGTDGNAGVEVKAETDSDGQGEDECDEPQAMIIANPMTRTPPSEESDTCEELVQETFTSTTNLTPKLRLLTTRTTALTSSRSSSNNNNNYNKDNNNTATHTSRSCTTPPMTSANCDGVIAEVQFRTPTASEQQKQMQQQRPSTAENHKPSPSSTPAPAPVSASVPSLKPNLLLIPPHSKVTSSAVGYETTPRSQGGLTVRKGVPKVNLTPIFLNSSSFGESASSAPIPISGGSASASLRGNCFSFDAPSTVGNQLQAPGTTSDGSIPVQKSYSAPTLPNSPSLSPRFAKQAVIYKRRSRHLSDRSDRSSLGSDEQFSDEELESGLYSPATSPMKTRSRLFAAFGRRSLFGNLEESLLQRRFVPKIEVLGFKVLLGASGGFCPMQLTIPAISYFYELPGKTLSTPYVCEIRLSRKGYSVPRSGTVQVTLLNPMGTVVRMFVIPYDMRDMPPLHQTFIRQRVLAEEGPNETVNNENGDSSNLMNDSNSNGSNNGGSDSRNSCANGGEPTTTMTTTTPTGDAPNSNSNKFRLSPNGGVHSESNLGLFISAEHMKRLRYSIHLRFQTSRSGRLSLHSDIRILISRRTDCDTAAAHARGVLETPNDVITDTVMPSNPKYSARQENSSKI